MIETSKLNVPHAWCESCLRSDHSLTVTVNPESVSLTTKIKICNNIMRTESPNIAQGGILIKELPFVFALKSSLRYERCDFCFSSGKVLKCSGCKYVSYCNKSCQTFGWDMHKEECPKFKKISPRVLPDAATILSRMIFKLKKGGGRERGYYTKKQFRVFKDLMSHYSDIKQDAKRMEHFTALYNVLLEFIGDDVPNNAELLGMYGRLVVNGFSILDPEMVAIGTGIYLGASIIDHSCDPTAVAVFQGTTLYIRTLIDMSPLDWSKVFICYVELLNSAEERKHELMETYFFLCECSRCKDIEEIHLSNAMQCPVDSCLAPVPIVKDNVESLPTCCKCKESVKQDRYKKFVEVKDFVSLQLQNMRDFSYLDVAKTCLQRQRDLFHPLNLQRVRLLDAAFESSITVGQWQEAVHYGKLLLPGYRRYYGELHPLTGILQMKVAKILLYLGQDMEAHPFLHGAKQVILITHGCDHPLFTDQLQPLLSQVQ